MLETKKDFLTFKIKAELKTSARAFCPKIAPWKTSSNIPRINAEVKTFLPFE